VSALTKVFVLLLVVLSLILTAGTVVYVNRAESFVQNKKQQDAAILAAKAQAESAAQDASMLHEQLNSMAAQMQNQRNLGDQTINQLRGAVAERDATIAQLNSNLLQATAGQKSSGDALVVAQKVIGTQNDQLSDLRKENLDLAKRNSDDSLAISDLTNKYETVRSQWRDSNEQNTQLQNENKNLHETLHKAGIAENSAPDINREPLVNVHGMVRSKQNIGGVAMATVDIGAADQITKGMQLKLIDPNSHDPFLGYLIVDRVEPNQAIGHLSGPRVNEVRPGIEVRSQL
jgi:chromosome segregation ATPase